MTMTSGRRGFLAMMFAPLLPGLRSHEAPLESAVVADFSTEELMVLYRRVVRDQSLEQVRRFHQRMEARTCLK